MDLHQLRYFEAAFRHRHFSRAADELHVAQSAVSHQVRRLERELGVELLRRSTRAVEPTEAGQLVADRARAILGQVDGLRNELDQLQGLVRGRVAVGAMLFGGELDIPATLADFSATYPEVELSIREGPAQRMVELLTDGTLDLAFALQTEWPPAVEGVRLSDEELVVVMSRGHALGGEDPLPVAALADQPLVAFARGAATRAVVDAAFERAGVRPRIAVEANDLSLVRTLVAHALGVSVLPRSFVERPGPAVTFRPLEPRQRMAVALWWRRGRTLSAAARAFVEFVDAARP